MRSAILTRLVQATTLILALAVAPSVTGEPICYVCGSASRTVGNPDAVVDIPAGFTDIEAATCADIEKAGLDGQLPAFACFAAQTNQIFQEPCACKDKPAPTASTAAPSLAPTAAAPLAPTTAVPLAPSATPISMAPSSKPSCRLGSYDPLCSGGSGGGGGVCSGWYGRLFCNAICTLFGTLCNDD